MSVVSRPLKMDAINIKRREYYHKLYSNPEKRKRIRELARKRYKEDTERFIKYTRKWKAENPDWYKLNQREYRKKNPKAPNGNASRNKKMWTAQNKAILETELAPFCELCPEDDVRPAKMRHHPDYNYPLIFVSVCQACHSNIHADLKKAKKSALIHTHQSSNP